MYLWVDLGNKKCWIAVYFKGIVFPKEIVPRIKIINILKKYINEYNIQAIIVWLPYDLYGKDLKQLEKTEKFGEKLKQIFPNLTIDFIDERFTSFQADSIINNGIKWSKDDISAALILESYLSKIWKI